MAIHKAFLFKQWSPHVMLFSGDQQLSEEDQVKLRALDIRVIDGDIDSLEITDDTLHGCASG